MNIISNQSQSAFLYILKNVTSKVPFSLLLTIKYKKVKKYSLLLRVKIEIILLNGSIIKLIFKLIIKRECQRKKLIYSAVH